MDSDITPEGAVTEPQGPGFERFAEQELAASAGALALGEVIDHDHPALADVDPADPQIQEWFDPNRLARLRVSVEEEIGQKTQEAYSQPGALASLDRKKLVAETIAIHLNTYFSSASGEEADKGAPPDVARAVGGLLRQPSHEFTTMMHHLKEKDMRIPLMQGFLALLDLRAEKERQTINKL